MCWYLCPIAVFFSTAHSRVLLSAVKYWFSWLLIYQFCKLCKDYSVKFVHECFKWGGVQPPPWSPAWRTSIFCLDLLYEEAWLHHAERVPRSLCCGTLWLLSWGSCRFGGCAGSTAVVCRALSFVESHDIDSGVLWGGFHFIACHVLHGLLCCCGCVLLIIVFIDSVWTWDKLHRV